MFKLFALSGGFRTLGALPPPSPPAPTSPPASPPPAPPPPPASVWSLAFVTSIRSGASTSSYSFAGLPIGTEDADREVVVVASASGVTSGATPTATFDGTPMARDGVSPRLGNGLITAVFRLAVPTGTSGTLQVTWNDPATECCVSVYRMTKRGATPVVTATNGTANAFGNFGLTVPVPAGGAAVVGTHANGASTDQHSYSGATRNAMLGSSKRFSSALRSADTGNVGVTIDGTYPYAFLAVGYGP